MKRYIYLLVAVGTLTVFSCQSSNQSKAEKITKTIHQGILNKYGPPEVSTSQNGYMMRAVIDGKSWSANQMMELNKSNTHFVHGQDGKHKIEFYIDRDHLKIGYHRSLAKNVHSASLYLPDGNIANSVKGNYIITKATDKVIEGTFQFTASPFKSNKIINVTDGFFRILLNKAK